MLFGDVDNDDLDTVVILSPAGGPCLFLLSIRLPSCLDDAKFSNNEPFKEQN